MELADDGDPALLDAVEKKLPQGGRTAVRRPLEAGPGPGRRPAPTTARAGQTHGQAAGAEAPTTRHAPATTSSPTSANSATPSSRYDPAVRRDLPDSVHQMRVATRRLRSAFKTYRKVLDRAVTDPIGEELKWLAARTRRRPRPGGPAPNGSRAASTTCPATLVLGPGPRPAAHLERAPRRSGSRRRADRRPRQHALPRPAGHPRRRCSPTRRCSRPPAASPRKVIRQGGH